LTALGVDVGKARVGLAFESQGVVLPLRTVSRDGAYESIHDECQQRKVEVIFIGLPLNLQGSNTASTEDAIEFARNLKTDVPVRLIDERMTTNIALTSAKGRKNAKAEVDSLSAAEILKLGLSNPSLAKDVNGF
jgi:putative Holliday junction resolvase